MLNKKKKTSVWCIEHDREFGFDKPTESRYRCPKCKKRFKISIRENGIYILSKHKKEV